jgi:hypothetical protein
MTQKFEVGTHVSINAPSYIYHGRNGVVTHYDSRLQDYTILLDDPFRYFSTVIKQVQVWEDEIERVQKFPVGRRVTLNGSKSKPIKGLVGVVKSFDKECNEYTITLDRPVPEYLLSNLVIDELAVEEDEIGVRVTVYVIMSNCLDTYGEEFLTEIEKIFYSKDKAEKFLHELNETNKNSGRKTDGFWIVEKEIE